MIGIGFIGFGEVAACFSAALAQHGATVAAYDLVLDKPGGLDVLKARATSKVSFAPLPDVIKSSTIVMSSVTSDVALAVAQACAPHLTGEQVFVDLNATSPSVKREIAAKLGGMLFVEGAILSAIGVSGAKSRILACGDKALFIAKTLTKHGLNVEDYGAEIGRASTFKLLRSVFSKGVEALLLEARLAARQAGLDDEVWAEIVATIDKHAFGDVGGNWMRTHGTAHERRYHEMAQVEALIEELGVDPVMTKATTAFFERSTRLGLSRSLKSKPTSADDVLNRLQELLRGAGPESHSQGAV